MTMFVQYIWVLFFYQIISDGFNVNKLKFFLTKFNFFLTEPEFVLTELEFFPLEMKYLIEALGFEYILTY